MAPSRRKGAGKAAAAAAAHRQWKIGDLVLAKVKGFPAWPATVSEPEKWGYPADWKKVLVFFFGTQQIAICNPADIEAFTEEKKQSLLGKRQGRGADFVRAVQEIIDSYEKSKKQDQVESNSADVVILANGGKSMDSSPHFGVKDRTRVSEATLDLQIKPFNSTTAGDYPRPMTEDVLAARQLGALPVKEASLEQPSDYLVKETPVLTTYSSRKRSSPTRRSRSLTRVESSKLQNFKMTYNIDRKNAVEISANVIQDGSLQMNKRTRKSPDSSECDDMYSSAFMSNDSIEDNSWEIVTAESDTFSLNEGSMVDSGCKVEHLENVVECFDGDVELRKGLDFKIKAVVIKKERKSNQKRVTNDAADPPARTDMEAELGVGTHNTCHISQNTGGNLDEKHPKEDGDEHLPLVKRARVRMGKPSSAEELRSSSQIEEKPSMRVTVNLLEQNSPSLKIDDEVLADTGLTFNEFTDNLSPSKISNEISGNRPQPWKGTKNQSFGGSADGEAALPPSKRLHRALEAMSANAAEEGQACVEASSTINKSINTFCADSISQYYYESEGSREGSSLGLQRVESLGNDASGLYSSSNPMCLEGSTKSSGEAHICDQLIKNSNSQKREFCGDDVGPVDNVDGKHLTGSSLSIHTIQTVVKTHSSELILPNTDRRQSSFRSDPDSLFHSLPLKDEGNTEHLQLEDFGAKIVDKNPITVEYAELILEAIPGTDKSAKLSPQNGASVHQYSSECVTCENTECLKSQIDDNGHISCKCEALEVKQKAKQKDTSSVSVSDDHLGDKGVTSVPYPVEEMDYPARFSPSNTSLCHTSTSESVNIVQSNGCSPHVHSLQKKTPVADEGKTDTALTQRPKFVGKLSGLLEAHTAVSSFEAVLGSLTRTKESIGRATRIAIDCAKFGVSSKVMEIVARNLESESSVHRRVDLFFLVDSIMQCSRSLKGDGGIYPSAILAVLPRLLSAAAPPGNVAQENRRQCLKALAGKENPSEFVIRHHMRELDSFCCSSSAGVYSLRSARTERALDDPVRDMDGMLVDEYGSNSSFQLPGFCMPRMLKDEDEGSDFEAVTPEHNSEAPDERDATSTIKKHSHILEDVDGELEMEDVAPTCDAEMSSTPGVDTVQTLQDQLLPFVPPLPQDIPPSSPPLPSSPPPPHPPPSPLLYHPCALSDPYCNGASRHNMQNDLQQCTTQQPVAPRINPTTAVNAVHYHEYGDLQIPMQMSESTSTFGSYPVCPLNNVQHTDSPMLHNKPYPPCPPHAPQSNQFSYVKCRREAPHPSHPHGFCSLPNIDGGNFCNNHYRMKLAPYEHQESWRFPAPSYFGQRYHDEAKESYAPGSPYEPTRFPNRGWAYPPRPMNHRNSLSMRPPSGGAIPVGIRAPAIWRPR